MHLALEDLAGIEVKSDLEGLTGLYSNFSVEASLLG
jgi:hypothetical protein